MNLLKETYEKFRIDHPKTRIRDAAQQLGVSELELAALNGVRLKDAIHDILKEVPSLGHVMALTRNDFAVHERKGSYRKVAINGQVGLVVNPDIDLRLFLGNWAYALAIEEGERRSIQFFDHHGDAVHKIYIQDEAGAEAFQQLVEKFREGESDRVYQLKGKEKEAEELQDAQIDIQGFQSAWQALQDTHEFHALLKEYKVSRTQAMRLAPVDMVFELNVDDLKAVLRHVADRGRDIMIFVGNKGCIQIHTGPVHRLVQTGPWFNVLDPDFNLHLRDDMLERIFLVRKPTKDGFVHSIEAYDGTGDLVIQFFGKRKPGEKERDDWREALAPYLPS